MHHRISSHLTFVVLQQFRGIYTYKDFGDGITQSIAYSYDVAERLLLQRHELVVQESPEVCRTPSGKYQQVLAYNNQGNIREQGYHLPLAQSNDPDRSFTYEYDHSKLKPFLRESVSYAVIKAYE